MIDFSPNYLDKIATRLETMSGDAREPGENSDGRILSALESMGNISNPNGDYQQRVCDAINNINIGGGGNGGDNIFNYNSDVYNTMTNLIMLNIATSPVGIADTRNYVHFDNSLTNLAYGMTKFISGNIVIPERGVNIPLPYFELSDIPDTVTNCEFMFSGAYFNQPVNIPNSVESCIGMFSGAALFNQPVTIPNSVTSCISMFEECVRFNQPVTVPESVDSISDMFLRCSSMNSLVRLPNKFNNGTTNEFWYRCPVSVANGTLEFY